MRIAAIANAGASHQMTMCAIGRALQKRGHEFVLLGTRFQARQLKLPDVPFELVGEGRADPAQGYWDHTRQGGLTISATLEYMKGMAALLCEELPALLSRPRFDFVLADQEEPGAATAADLAGLPYASICSSLPLNEAYDIPPGFLDWQYSAGLLPRLRNRVGYSLRNLAISGVNRVLNSYRRPKGLRPYRKPDDSFSTRAQITQLVPEFDFPWKNPLPVLHYVGPFQRQALTPVDFPYERLNGRPLIYTSFGTTFGARWEELNVIAQACAQLPVQLVISLGGFESGGEENKLQGHPVVVRYAPQRELLSRAALTITHAGLNTALEALSLGVPLLAMPIAGDQLGVAARLRYHGAGMMLRPKQRTVVQVSAAISSLLEDARWRSAAQRMASAISRSGGPPQAAEIIEAAASLR